MRSIDPRFVFLGVSMATVLMMCAGNSAAHNRYVEDFSTRQYCDLTNTTALWDTLLGKLSLPPFEFALTGSYNTDGAARGVAVSGDYAYVADYTNGLVVVDISDPASPAFAGDYGTGSTAEGIAISGDYAYVANYSNGLVILDISDPTTPTLAGSYATAGMAYGIAICGDYAYVADEANGLVVVDISDPTTPSLAGSYDTPGHALSVAVNGNHAFVADGENGLVVLNISDPTSPTLAGSYDTVCFAYDVAVDGDHAYLANDSCGSLVFDISDPTSPALVGTYSTGGNARGVAICGDRAYVADYSNGLAVLDISDPTSPSLTGGYDTAGYSYGVVVSGEYAYVADSNSGIVVIKIADPLLPVLAAAYDTPGSVTELATSGNYLYVTDWTDGLLVMDISDPASPSLAGAYDTPGTARDVEISGNHAFVADGNSGLVVLDISDPTSPSLAGTNHDVISASGLAVSGDYAYVADWDSGLVVLDISDPTTPTLAGSYNTAGYAVGVVVSGDHAYVADYSNGLVVVDISDPTTPTLAGSYDTDGDAYALTVSGDYVYVGDGYNGLVVIDISDPTSPSLAGGYDTPGYSRVVAKDGDRAFVSDDATGLVVLDVSDPTSPGLEGVYNTAGYDYGVTINGIYAYVGDWSSGLVVLKVFENAVISGSDTGRSVVINPIDKDILTVKLTTSQTDSIYWYISADSGSVWDETTPDDVWHRLASPGNDLMWRSRHVYKANLDNPTCTSLDVEWLHTCAVIDSIVDVPDDQGGWVRLSLTRSGYDFADEASLPVTGYQVYQRVDEMKAALSHVRPEVSSDLSAVKFKVSPIDGVQNWNIGDRVFARAATLASSFPPGTWEVVGWIAATQSDDYTARISTVEDSTGSGGIAWSDYLITTHTTTPSIWFVSPPDSGYSVDNLPPDMPGGLAAQYTGDTDLWLHWNLGSENDLSHWAVYRGTEPDFVANEVSRIGTTTDTSFVDGDYGYDDPYYYKVSAFDVHGNESSHALLAPDDVTGVPGKGPSYVNALFQNVPNPFGSGTRIAFSLAKAGWVTLKIFDVKGRLVRVLVDEERGPNRYVDIWDGKDNSGRSVAAGTYFYRLDLPGWSAAKKMTFVR